MSEASTRGKDFELRIQKITSKILGIQAKRDKRSGAGLHKQDIRDQYGQLPLFIECKDQDKLNVKRDFRIAATKAVVGQAPVVVFPDDNEVLCVMRYQDVLQLIKEARDWQDTAEQLRLTDTAARARSILHITQATSVQPAKGEQNTNKECRNGHIADGYGYCSWKRCQYQRGARKVKK